MRSKIAKGESFIVIGVAAALIAICVAGLGSFLAHAEGAEADTVHDEALPTADLTLTDEVTAPEGLTVKVDTRGIDLPEDAVSAQYAAALAADIAERSFNLLPSGRCAVSLRDSATTLDEDYFGFAGLYWNVELETENGLIRTSISASTGVDYQSNLVLRGKTDWQWFDTWNSDEGGSGYYGTEQELVAQYEEIVEKYGEDYGKPLMTEDEIAYVHDMKRAAMMENAASWVDLPHAEKAIELVNDRGIGNGATAVSARTLMNGGSSSIGSIYVVEVTLDDGTYLFVNVGEESLELSGYQRSATDLPTLMYG